MYGRKFHKIHTGEHLADFVEIWQFKKKIANQALRYGKSVEFPVLWEFFVSYSPRLVPILWKMKMSEVVFFWKINGYYFIKDYIIKYMREKWNAIIAEQGIIAVQALSSAIRNSILY